jgi:hypothetical protein
MAQPGNVLPSNAPLKARLGALSEALHRAYCMAICLDRALRHNESDDSPELAVCVHEHLVRPLDALSFEVEQLKTTLEPSEPASPPPSGAETEHD